MSFEYEFHVEANWLERGVNFVALHHLVGADVDRSRADVQHEQRPERCASHHCTRVWKSSDMSKPALTQATIGKPD